MSEIATGKLVIWMRLQAKRIIPAGKRTSIMLSAAADRIEQQEQRIANLENELATYKKTFCPECHMPMGSNEKKCSECDVSWALEGE